MNMLSAAIAFISTIECGIIKKVGEILAHIEGRIGRGGEVNRAKHVTYSEQGNG